MSHTHQFRSDPHAARPAVRVRATEPARPRPGPIELLPKLQSISRSVRILMQAHLQPGLLSLGAEQVLWNLRESGQTELRNLQREVQINASTVSKIVDRFERQGLVSRRIDPKDRRRVLLTLTEAGLKKRNKLLAALGELEDELQDLLRNEAQALVVLGAVAKILAEAAAETR